MPEVWRDIFKKYITSYEAIKTLNKNDIMDRDDVVLYEGKLLDDIIETFKSEVEE